MKIKPAILICVVCVVLTVAGFVVCRVMFAPQFIGRWIGMGSIQWPGMNDLGSDNETLTFNRDGGLVIDRSTPDWHTTTTYLWRTDGNNIWVRKPGTKPTHENVLRLNWERNYENLYLNVYQETEKHRFLKYDGPVAAN